MDDVKVGDRFKATLPLCYGPAGTVLTIVEITAGPTYRFTYPATSGPDAGREREDGGGLGFFAHRCVRLPRETPDEVVARHAADSKELASKPAFIIKITTGGTGGTGGTLEYEKYLAAMPLVIGPPKCKPDCTPAQPCQADNVCPVFREPIAGCAVDEAVHRASKLEDQREAREWRSQRYEPSTSGLGGGFVGSWNKRAVR